MKIKYAQDTDTLHIELYPAEDGAAQNFDENTFLGLDNEGRLASLTIEHASDRIDIYSLKSVSATAKGRLNLSAEEQGWLNEFRRQLHETFPGQVEGLYIYGPYSRGISDPEVEMNVIVVLSESDQKAAEKIVDLSYEIGLRYALSPYLEVFAMEEWKDKNRIDSMTYRELGDDRGISVL